MSTPGMPLVWCFGFGSEIDLSVMTDSGSIFVGVTETETEVRLDSVSELVAWLQAHRAGSLRDKRSGLLHKLKAGRFLKWE